MSLNVGCVQNFFYSSKLSVWHSSHYDNIFAKQTISRFFTSLQLLQHGFHKITMINIRNFSPIFLRITVPTQAYSINVQESHPLSRISVGTRFTTDLSYVRLHTFCHTVYVKFTTVSWIDEGINVLTNSRIDVTSSTTVALCT